MMVGHRLYLGFILSVMRNHWSVQIREAVISDLLFKISLVDIWKIDCGRARKEAGKPVRRLFQ